MSKKELDLGPSTAFLEENSTTDDKSVIKVARGAYKSFMEERGIPESVLQATAGAHSELYGGMVMVAGQRLATRVEETKAAGDDPTDLVQRLEVTRQDGTAYVDVRAKKVSPNPRHAEHGGPKNITTYGGVRMSLRVKTQVPGQAVEHVSRVIRAAMGEDAGE